MPALASVANVDIINFGSFLIEICWLHLQIKLPLFADAAEACVSVGIHVKLLKQDKLAFYFLNKERDKVVSMLVPDRDEESKE